MAIARLGVEDIHRHCGPTSKALCLTNSGRDIELEGTYDEFLQVELPSDVIKPRSHGHLLTISA